eukprot:CAMPEP_0178382090 /NCGR_PEP_ID=MMETSP0689_2-20121128/6317_1 /TAXON_ID=160604 /ORGANISM="Amphidinium massartii, Strain CS-259" /LENGTH=525 /DNA_ID=CAMNT_0020002289 /DNA_START=98 /DNA_END=1675 /DNA_ORIENTATION=-
MNGDYILSQTPGANDTMAKFPRQFQDYPGGATFFDVYSPPVTSLYSQVFWKQLPPVDLPKEVVESFHGKGMAVIGFEVDQVRQTPSGDVSVPLTVAYNHHFESTMIGRHAAFEKVEFNGPEDPRLQAMLEGGMGHGIPSMEEHWMAVEQQSSPLGLPTKQSFGGANGGEYRKTFHGYAPGYVQVIDSPTKFQMTPMQIDTWNRDRMNLTYPSPFVAGPLPKASLAPPDALYSGLLECPVTTRLHKTFNTDSPKEKPFGTVKGTLQYQRTKQSVDEGSQAVIPWRNKCTPRPRSDLLAMENPTCDLRTYTGGQIACQHLWSLLDAEQEIPWADQPLTYHLKFRFWVQEYNPQYHKQIGRTTWGLASPVEYDVPKCSKGMMGCTQSPDGNWVHTITGTFSAKGRLVAAHFHCHAPTCLSVALYRCPAHTHVCNATNGELLCREEPGYGNGHYKAAFEEPGYIYQPPCLWGDAQFGLEPPPLLTGYTLGGVKTANATAGHHGEMAWLQVFFGPDEVEGATDEDGEYIV